MWQLRGDMSLVHLTLLRKMDTDNIKFGRQRRVINVHYSCTDNSVTHTRIKYIK